MIPFINMVRLTLRELKARAIIIGLFLVATLVWVMLAFALNLDIVDGTLAAFRIFGQDITDEPLPPEFGLENLVIGVQTFVAGAAYWVGMLLALFGTASLIPSMLAPGEIDLILTKPVSRSTLLAARLTGVFLAAAVLLVYLLGMVWLVMSIKSGIWSPRLLIAIGLIWIVFVALYGIVTLIGVWKQSSALNLIVVYGLIFVSIIFTAHEPILELSGPTGRFAFQFFYHLLPNFAEVTESVVKLVAGEVVTDWYPASSTLGFGFFCYVGAFYIFSRKDF